MEEDVAFVSSQSRTEDGEGFILWLEASCGPHLILEYSSKKRGGLYMVSAVGYSEDEELAERLVISNNQVSLERGLYDNKGKFFVERKPDLNVSLTKINEFDSRLPLPPPSK